MSGSWRSLASTIVFLPIKSPCKLLNVNFPPIVRELFVVTSWNFITFFVFRSLPQLFTHSRFPFQVCRMGKYHNVLYIALKVAWSWNIKDSAVICMLLCERENSFVEVSIKSFIVFWWLGKKACRVKKGFWVAVKLFEADFTATKKDKLMVITFFYLCFEKTVNIL